ncbi:MAG TPA: hypothetical protein VMV04_16880 [Thermodesulfobacteriota bacterium]|nr:hypothetical protein [Thermodesulfobacteriota bacterium]
MERGSLQGYAASLERTMETMYLDLGEAIYELEKLCPLITADRNGPMEIVTDIRLTYKRIQDQLTKIRGVKQVMEGKYRQYYHRNSQREKEILEFTFLAKSLYSKFERTLKEMEEKKKLNDREEQFGGDSERIPVQWFQSQQKQFMLLRNLRDLWDLNYKTQLGLECEQRRRTVQKGMRSISLFVMSGEATLIDHLQSRMQLREYDIKERSAEGECRGALTHLKAISPLDVEKVMRRFTGGPGFATAKCLLFRIQSEKDLEREIFGSTWNILTMMEVGELRTLPI